MAGVGVVMQLWQQRLRLLRWLRRLGCCSRLLLLLHWTSEGTSQSSSHNCRRCSPCSNQRKLLRSSHRRAVLLQGPHGMKCVWGMMRAMRTNAINSSSNAGAALSTNGTL